MSIVAFKTKYFRGNDIHQPLLVGKKMTIISRTARAPYLIYQLGAQYIHTLFVKYLLFSLRHPVGITV